MSVELNRQVAAKLYDLLTLKVSNVRVNPRQHRGEVIFVGYADFQIELNGIPFIQLCGNSIKLIGDSVHFDPKSERGSGDRSNHFFPHWFPMTAEVRAVLNEQLKRDVTIKAMCKDVKSKLENNHQAVSTSA